MNLQYINTIERYHARFFIAIMAKKNLHSIINMASLLDISVEYFFRRNYF